MTETKNTPEKLPVQTQRLVNGINLMFAGIHHRRGDCRRTRKEAQSQAEKGGGQVHGADRG